MKTSKEIQGGLQLKRRLQNTILGQKGYVQFFKKLEEKNIYVQCNAKIHY